MFTSISPVDELVMESALTFRRALFPAARSVPLLTTTGVVMVQIPPSSEARTALLTILTPGEPLDSPKR